MGAVPRNLVALWLCLGLACILRAAEKPGEWREYPKGFHYASAWLSCFVRPDGTVSAVKARDVLLVRELFLHGTYKPKNKHDARFFQHASKPAGPLKLKKLGEDRYAVTKAGILRNKRYAHAARYAQRMTISPNQIEFDYEVELIVPLANTANIFLTLLCLPAETYANRGFRMTRIGGGQSLCVFPEQYDKQSDVRAGRLKELRVVLSEGHFVLEAGENTSIVLSDTRSYGGKDFRADVHARIPWRRRPVTWPAGAKFAWSFRLVFDHEK